MARCDADRPAPLTTTFTSPASTGPTLWARTTSNAASPARVTTIPLVSFRRRSRRAYLPCRDACLNALPEQRRPACVPCIRRVVAVRPDELGPAGDLALARGVQVDELHAARSGSPRERLVETDGARGNAVLLRAPLEARCHREIRDQVRDDDRRRLVGEPPEDGLEVLLVGLDRHPSGDVVGSDREGDEVRAQL